MDILLIRHGQCESSLSFSSEKNRPDPPLTARGREQAALLGARLSGLGIQRIYASDLIRAGQTAHIANERIEVPVEVWEELREIDMGRRSWEDVRGENPALYEAWIRHDADLPYPGGECGGDVAARAMKVIDEIVAGGLDTVAVVTHGGVIRVLICAALGIGQEKRFRLGPPENTSISVLKYDTAHKRFDLFSMNDFSHLLSLSHTASR